MSLGSLSGQFIVMMSSAFKSTAPVFAVGLMREKAVKTINVKPSSTLKSISVNGTNVPSSLLAERVYSSIDSILEGGDDVHFRDLSNVIEKFEKRLVEEEVLELQEEGGRDPGHGYVEGCGHSAAHSGEGLAQRFGVEGDEASDRDQHQDEADRGSEQRQTQQRLRNEKPELFSGSNPIGQGTQ